MHNADLMARLTLEGVNSVYKEFTKNLNLNDLQQNQTQKRLSQTQKQTHTEIDKYKMQKRKEHTGFYIGSDYSYV